MNDKINEVAKKLAARGVTPLVIRMHPRTGVTLGIHATHVSTPSGVLAVVYDAGVPDGVLNAEGNKVVVDHETLSLDQPSAPTPHKKGSK